MHFISQILRIENDETDLTKETLRINYAHVWPEENTKWYQSRLNKTADEEAAFDWANQFHYHLREQLADIKPDGYSVHIQLLEGNQTRGDDELLKEKLRVPFEAWLLENKDISNPGYKNTTGRYIREDVNNAFEAYIGALKQFRVRDLKQSLYDNINAWEDEEDSVQEEHSQLIAQTKEIALSIPCID